MKSLILTLTLLLSTTVFSTPVDDVRNKEDIKLVARSVCAEISQTRNFQSLERVQIIKSYGINPLKAVSLNKSIEFRAKYNMGDIQTYCRSEVYYIVLLSKNWPAKK